jgi:hypothetical protein
MTSVDVVQEYIKGAALHGLGTESGDHEKANEGYKVLNKAYLT